MVRTDAPGLDFVTHLVEVGEEPLESPSIVVLALPVSGQAVLQLAQRLLVEVDHRHLVGFLARQRLRRRAPDLTGTEDEDFHGVLGGGRVLTRGA